MRVGAVGYSLFFPYSFRGSSSPFGVGGSVLVPCFPTPHLEQLEVWVFGRLLFPLFLSLRD